MPKTTRKQWKEKKQARYRDKLESQGFAVKSVVVHADDYQELRRYAGQLREKRRQILERNQQEAAQ